VTFDSGKKQQAFARLVIAHPGGKSSRICYNSRMATSSQIQDIEYIPIDEEQDYLDALLMLLQAGPEHQAFIEMPQDGSKVIA